MSREDQLVNKLVEHYSDDELTKSVAVEQHYNHYGDRGIVDVVVEDEMGPHLYEVKSPSAIANATGANEILRQFNRMREYYYRDHNVDRRDDVTFELCFTPDVECLRHVESNLDMYRATVRETLDIDLPSTVSNITIRPIDGDEISPAILLGGEFDFTNHLDDEWIIPNNPDLSKWIRSHTTLK